MLQRFEHAMVVVVRAEELSTVTERGMVKNGVSSVEFWVSGCTSGLKVVVLMQGLISRTKLP